VGSSVGAVEGAVEAVGGLVFAALVDVSVVLVAFDPVVLLAFEPVGLRVSSLAAFADGSFFVACIRVLIVMFSELSDFTFIMSRGGGTTRRSPSSAPPRATDDVESAAPRAASAASAESTWWARAAIDASAAVK